MVSESEIAPELFARIEKEIASDESPVGIDAKKTHVLILWHLMEIERRLGALEKRLAAAEAVATEPDAGA